MAKHREFVTGRRNARQAFMRLVANGASNAQEFILSLK
jgi:hypothetical protein